jgi:hypothetical protein
MVVTSLEELVPNGTGVYEAKYIAFDFSPLILFVLGVILTMALRPYHAWAVTVSSARIYNSAKASSCDTGGEPRTRSMLERRESVVVFVSHVGVS